VVVGQLTSLGTDLEQLSEVPSDTAAMHSAYAKSYKAVGVNLTKIANAKTDQEYLDAIATYNTSADDLTKRFLALVALFSANNVQFSSSDPGSMFVFNANISL